MFSKTTVKIGVSASSITFAAVTGEGDNRVIDLYQTEKLIPGKYQLGTDNFGLDIIVSDDDDIYSVKIENIYGYDRSDAFTIDGYTKVALTKITEYI